jgi:hypothetical protein
MEFHLETLAPFGLRHHQQKFSQLSVLSIC